MRAGGLWLLAAWSLLVGAGSRVATTTYRAPRPLYLAGGVADDDGALGRIGDELVIRTPAELPVSTGDLAYLVRVQADWERDSGPLVEPSVIGDGLVVEVDRGRVTATVRGGGEMARATVDVSGESGPLDVLVYATADLPSSLYTWPRGTVPDLGLMTSGLLTVGVSVYRGCDGGTPDRISLVGHAIDQAGAAAVPEVSHTVVTPWATWVHQVAQYSGPPGDVGELPRRPTQYISGQALAEPDAELGGRPESSVCDVYDSGLPTDTGSSDTGDTDP